MISNNGERTLAYKTAQAIQDKELKDISGGGIAGTTTYTTTQTADNYGNYDVGGDILWDM